MAAVAEKTDPALWDKVKQQVTQADKGGRAGQWSARKAQLAVQAYKKAGGGYKGARTPDNHLRTWEREDWGTRSGHRSAETGERYLPRRAREHLSKAEYERTSAKKRADTRAGRQFSAQPRDIARKTAADRDTGGKATQDRRAIVQEFARVVNIPPARLRQWLQGEESRSVGMRPGGERVTSATQGEAVGHQMGRRILEIRGKRQAALTEDDLAAMRKVIGYVHRHGKQRPRGDVSNTRWRRSLMNWGHDPLRVR